MAYSSLDLYKLTTKRFELSPLRVKHARPLHALWNEPDVRKYLWDDKAVSMELVQEILQTNERWFEEKHFGIWGINRWGHREILGFVGFWHFFDPPVLELLFGLHPELWKKGVARECAAEIIRYGFEECKFDSILASTDTPNTASIRTLEGLDMLPDPDRPASESTRHYNLTLELWQLAKQSK